MNRYEFLKSCGFTGGALLTLLISCGKDIPGIEPPDDDGPVAGGPDESLKITTEELEKISPLFRVDLTSPLYSKLLVPNNYMVLANTFVLALSKRGVYIAATVVCSHEKNRTISYVKNEWYCPVHGARYNLDGKGLNENGKNGIKIYKTAWDGDTVVIYE